MMGEEAPETFWATHKRQVINLWNCWILLVNLFELSIYLFQMGDEGGDTARIFMKFEILLLETTLSWGLRFSVILHSVNL